MGAEALDWLLRSAALTSLAVLVVLALRRPLRRLCGAGAACALWAVVPLTALAPLLPAWQPATPAQGMLAPVVAAVSAPLRQTIVAAPANAAALLVAWAAGALALAVALTVRQRRFRRALGALVRLGDGTWRAEGDVAGPVVLGLLRPRVVLPRDFAARYTPAQRALVLAHERLHLRRGDVPASALASALLCLYWFNPMMHWALARFRLDQELACDAAVLARHPGARRHYAEAMLNLQLAAPGLPVGCTWQSGHPLKERIMMLKQPLPGRLRRSGGLAAALALALACGIAAAGGSATPARPGDTHASYRSMKPPAYPAEAVAAKISGRVVLRVLVAADGTPAEVEIENATPEGVFEQASIDAVKSWRFNPARRDGEAIASWVTLPIDFEIDADPAAPGPAATPDGTLDALYVRPAQG